MSKERDSGRNPSLKELREADRVANLHPSQQRVHPSAVPADPSKLDHINTYGALPDYYIDQPFTCRLCTKREIWRARDQKWYYEEAKGHIDSVAVECHDCRKSKKQKPTRQARRHARPAEESFVDMPDPINKAEGRRLFGSDAANYDVIRPSYPEEIYQFLTTTGALRPNRATLEIGAGNGLATRRLLESGVNPLTAIEPDTRFSPILKAMAASYPTEFTLIASPFEEAELNAQSCDLIVAATSFHWVARPDGMRKAARLLKPEGHVALWWNVFGDPSREDPYHEATRDILGSLRSSPSGAPDAIPYALDVDARLSDFAQTGAFATPEHAFYRWTLILSPEQTAALYATFSSISELPRDEARAVLDQLTEVAQRQFGGTVERNMVSAIYVAQCRSRSGAARR